MTYNDLEMTFNYLLNLYIVIALSNKTMKINPPYYLGYHTQVYIFQKNCLEKAIFHLSYEG